MELQWQKLDRAIEAQPMPSQFTETKAWITCNDCAARTCTKYHWLGNKCTICDSYNTNFDKLVNSPVDQELEAVASGQAALAIRAAERNAANSEDSVYNMTLMSHNRINQAPQDDAVSASVLPISTRSAQSSTDPHGTQQNTPRLERPAHASLHALASPGGRIGDLPNYPATLNAHSHEENIVRNSNPVDPEIASRADEVDDEDYDDDEEEEDDVGFWGEGISPSTWSLPMGISPMSGWTSPSFFATRIEAGTEVAARDQQVDQPEDQDDVEEEGEWSSDDSDEPEEAVEVEEDGDVDEIELFGHR